VIPVGTAVAAPSRDGTYLRGWVDYTHDNRNPYAGDRTCYGIRVLEGGVSDGWTSDELTITGEATETSARFGQGAA
jgi:hypothetical protein